MLRKTTRVTVVLDINYVTSARRWVDERWSDLGKLTRDLDDSSTLFASDDGDKVVSVTFDDLSLTMPKDPLAPIFMPSWGPPK